MSARILSERAVQIFPTGKEKKSLKLLIDLYGKRIIAVNAYYGRSPTSTWMKWLFSAACFKASLITGSALTQYGHQLLPMKFDTNIYYHRPIDIDIWQFTLTCFIFSTRKQNVHIFAGAFKAFSQFGELFVAFDVIFFHHFCLWRWYGLGQTKNW